MNVLYPLIIVSFLLISQSASAHLKWFVNNEQLITSNIQYSLNSIEVIIWTLICIGLIVFSFWLNRNIKSQINVNKSSENIIFRIFLILVGTSLIFASYSESIVASHYVVTNKFLVILQYMQAIVGMMLLFNVFVTAASCILILIYASLITQFGIIELLDYLNILGIALFIIFFKQTDEQQKRLAVPLIRIFTGIALAVLAFSEKLLNPNLGLNFLQVHEWNFMKTLGIESYSNELFILSAGFVELLIGVLFILGIITRTNTIILLCFMITSNVIFLVQDSFINALIELAGHLPVIAIAIILISFGSGKKWKIQ